MANDDRIPSAVRAKALHGAGVLAHEQGELAQASACYVQSLALQRSLGDQRGIAAALNSLGVVALDQGDYDRARSLYEESLLLKRELGDQRGIAYSLSNLGLVTSAQGDYRFAGRLYAEALRLCRALGDRLGVAVALGNLGAVALELHDGERARPAGSKKPCRSSKQWAIRMALPNVSKAWRVLPMNTSRLNARYGWREPRLHYVR